MDEYYYVGCYLDYPSNRDLPYQFWDTSLAMTVDYCIDHCLKNYFLLAGLQFS